MTKIFLLLLFAVSGSWADSNRVDPKTSWTHSWAVGEDATSTFYQFIGPNRVRILWNGGGQNLPTVTDYFFPGGEIKVVHQTGLRKDLPDLIRGRDTGFKVTSSYSLACEHSGKMLVPPLPNQTLTDKQRLDLYNMILVLMEDRDLYRQGIRTNDVGAKVNPLEGSWVGSEMWEGRKKEPVEVVKKISMIFKGDEVRVIKDSKVAKRTFTIDHSKKPHRMDLQRTAGGQPGRPLARATNRGTMEGQFVDIYSEGFFENGGRLAGRQISIEAQGIAHNNTPGSFIETPNLRLKPNVILDGPVINPNDGNNPGGVSTTLGFPDLASGSFAGKKKTRLRPTQYAPSTVNRSRVPSAVSRQAKTSPNTRIASRGTPAKKKSAKKRSFFGMVISK